MKRNLTLTIDSEILEGARVAAAKRKSTLTGLIREFLMHTAGQDQAKEASLKRLQKVMRAKPLGTGSSRWTRQDLHAR